MKYAVVSDLHANLSALRHVLDDARESGAERIVCLGDVVGYGPLPAETIALVRKSASIILAGNHDDAVSGRIGSSDFIDLASDAAERHRAQLSRGDIAWLRSLPYTARLDGVLAAHGDLTDPESFNYVDSEEAAAQNFAQTDTQLIFVGHTHTPCIYLTGASGRIYRLEPQDFVVEDGKRYIVNPGSVGYPRENGGKCFSTYVIYDSAARTVTFRSLPFAVSSVMQRGSLEKDFRGLRLAAAAAAVLAIAAAAYIAISSIRSDRPTPEDGSAAGSTPHAMECQSPNDDSHLVLATKSLTLPPSARTVRANLHLGKKSSPVQLETTFLDATGKTLSQESKPVKISYTRAIRIPKGTVSVRFKALKTADAGTPVITSFAPQFLAP